MYTYFRISFLSTWRKSVSSRSRGNEFVTYFWRAMCSIERTRHITHETWNPKEPLVIPGYMVCWSLHVQIIIDFDSSALYRNFSLWYSNNMCQLCQMLDSISSTWYSVYPINACTHTHMKAHSNESKMACLARNAWCLYVYIPVPNAYSATTLLWLGFATDLWLSLFGQLGEMHSTSFRSASARSVCKQKSRGRMSTIKNSTESKHLCNNKNMHRAMQRRKRCLQLEVQRTDTPLQWWPLERCVTSIPWGFAEDPNKANDITRLGMGRMCADWQQTTKMLMSRTYW